ncbi:MAG: CDP-2,3-bis-(O-geranylgeranyl)-sn-glycerol synthase [Methanomicrobiaceae archaeon]|nr:CDP-2,3-bis-(O-geranylgeranyl)-sn-glycerol synthase [Methanomicrobiaceae archaeon]
MSPINFDIIEILVSLFMALWIMLPAYVPNSAAAIFGGGKPVDFGKYWGDGRRIFGEGKTWRGFFGGVFSGIFVGIILILISNYAGFEVHTLLSVVLLATGALVGDLIKSFFKRRLDKKRGEEWLIADQYDLVAGSLLLVFLFDPGWALEYITIPVLIWILIITPLLHRGANIIGYIIGVKEVPW